MKEFMAFLYLIYKRGIPSVPKGQSILISLYDTFIVVVLRSGPIKRSLFLSISGPNLLTSNSIFITEDIIIDEGD